MHKTMLQRPSSKTKMSIELSHQCLASPLIRVLIVITKLKTPRMFCTSTHVQHVLLLPTFFAHLGVDCGGNEIWKKIIVGIAIRLLMFMLIKILTRSKIETATSNKTCLA